MSFLPVPTVPYRSNDLTLVPSNTWQGITLDLHHVAKNVGDTCEITKINKSNTPKIILERPLTLSSSLHFSSRANLFVDNDKIYAILKGLVVGVFDLEGRLTKRILAQPSTIPRTGKPTLFQRCQTIRKTKYGKIIISWVYATSIGGTTDANENPEAFILNFDSNGNLINSNTLIFNSRAFYGLTNSVSFLYYFVNDSANVFCGVYPNSGPTTLLPEDRAKNLDYGSTDFVGQLGTCPPFLQAYASSSTLVIGTPNVQGNSTSSSADYNNVSFNSKYWIMTPSETSFECVYSRGVAIRLLIPKQFIDDTDNSVVTVPSGTFTIRMYTDGNIFGVYGTVSGKTYLFLAEFPTNRSIPINNYSLGIGAKRK